MRTWENFIKTELKKYTSYSKDDIISLFTITELKEFSRRIIMKFQYGIFDTDLYRKEYPDKIDSWLIELKPEQLHNLEIVDNYANHMTMDFIHMMTEMQFHMRFLCLFN